MGRPTKHRCCRRYRADRVYKPQGIPLQELKELQLPLDQFEALRLCDYEGLDQTAAGEEMRVSRGTVQRLLWEGRKTLISAILKNQVLIVNLKGKDCTHARMHSHKQRCRS